jgi:Peptidase family M1 domain
MPSRHAVALLFLLLAAPSAATAAARPHHALRIDLDPAAGRLAVVDRVDLPRGGEIDFLLQSGLVLSGSDPRVEEVPLGDIEQFTGINAAPVERAGAGELKRYRVTLPPTGGTVRLEYAGPFDFGLDDPEQEYARGMRETTGIVSATGVYLAGSGFWYPVFDDDLIEFDLEAPVPSGWHLISQGDGISRGDDGEARWSSAGPADEIYLVGGPLTLYRRPAGAAEAQVYLRTPDDELAERYLGATADYLEMYARLIGPYPYRKFALVENFWETGYGMPSFTLLGSQVIRLPFILTSSYPHEILHNWWGNSVFVDYASGNWCEGLTAYLADHLIQEQNGRGAAYRRDALQRYRSYVSAGRDFPLVEFRSRHSAATEAVGYGKTLMGFHMLRRRVGDATFRAWLGAFYAEQRGTRASFADVRRSLEKVSGRDLSRFFTEWTERTGAPALAVVVDGVDAREGAFTTRGTLRQTQAGAPYELEVPIVLQTVGAPVSFDVALGTKETRFEIVSPDRPLALHVDPAFDLFRALDPLEIPPSIGQIFGEQRLLAVVAAGATPDQAAAYRRMIEAWANEHQMPEIVTDRDLAALPADRGIWLLGRDNRFAIELFGKRAELDIGASAVSILGQPLPFAGHTLVAVARNPAATGRAIGWIAADPVAALPGLARKLPHDGKYSYLGFEGTDPTNVLKGQWTGADSPLTVDLRSEADRNAPLRPLAIEPESPLVPAAAPGASGGHPGAARTSP